MPAVDTVVVFVHGANQGDKTESQNRDAWEQAFEAEPDNARMIGAILSGEANQEIATYHERKHGSCQFPAYVDKAFVWYGDVYKAHADDFAITALNASREEDEDDRQPIIERLERRAMKKHFDIDDLLENSMVSDDEDRFDDVRVWTIPFQNIGHGRVNWFARDSFIKKLTQHMKLHLYG